MMKFILTFIFTVFLTPVLAMDIQEVQSEKGISALLAEENSIPIVSIEILFRGGSSLDDIEKHGATYLMTGLLEEGAGELDATQFAEQTENLAVDFYFNSNHDNIRISATMLKENLDPSIDLLSWAINEPRFDQVAFDRVQGQVEAIIRSGKLNPRSLAGDAFNASSYGDHPYGINMRGTLESVAKLTPEDMHEAHKATFVRDRVTVAVVGDITAEELAPILDKLFANLPTSTKELPPMVTPKTENSVEVIDFDNSQSFVVFGHEGLLRDDPDYMAAFVLNHIIGSGYSSRLNQEVRENRGLTYGISTYLHPSKSSGMIIGSFASANDKVAEALKIVKEEWRRVTENGVTQEELDAAKQYLTGSYALRFDSNSAIAGFLVSLQYQNLPLDYFETRNDQMNALTLEDINRVAKTLLQPDQLFSVVVGKPEGL